MADQDPAKLTSTPQTGLPGAAGDAAHEQPELWSALQALGAEATKAGPLGERERRLVHLALALAAGSEGATHSHARRAMAEGMRSEELEHVAWLAVTTLGWPQAIRGLTWIRDVTRPRGGG